jgi:hypothetical protein
MNAGLLTWDARDVTEAAERALSILQPIENWPGVARAYGARAQARERLGDAVAAEADRAAQRDAEAKIAPQPDP